MREKRKITPFGVWVKTQLANRDMTMVELANILCLPKSRITDVTRGESMKYAKNIATILCNSKVQYDEVVKEYQL